MYFHMTGGQIWTELVRKTKKKKLSRLSASNVPKSPEQEGAIRSLLLLIRRLE